MPRMVIEVPEEFTEVGKAMAVLEWFDERIMQSAQHRRHMANIVRPAEPSGPPPIENVELAGSGPDSGLP